MLLFFATIIRWLHGKCDSMQSEEDCEISIEYGYQCLFCRKKDEPPPHVLGMFLFLTDIILLN